MVKICEERKLETSGKKYELVERLVLSGNEKPPPEFKPYDGSHKVPRTSKEITKLPVCYLQSVLAWHNFPICGTKDELVIRVTLIANKREHLCLKREQKKFLDLIIIAKDLLLEEQTQRLMAETGPIYQHRTFATPTTTAISSDRPRYNAAVQTQYSEKTQVAIPNGVSTVGGVIATVTSPITWYMEAMIRVLIYSGSCFTI